MEREELMHPLVHIYGESKTVQTMRAQAFKIFQEAMREAMEGDEIWSAMHDEFERRIPEMDHECDPDLLHKTVWGMFEWTVNAAAGTLFYSHVPSCAGPIWNVTHGKFDSVRDSIDFADAWARNAVNRRTLPELREACKRKAKAWAMLALATSNEPPPK